MIAGASLFSRRPWPGRVSVRRSRPRAVAAAAFVLALVAVAASARAAADADGVLILHSNQRPLPAGVIIEDTLRATIPEQLGRPVQMYSEYLDIEWSPDQEYGEELAALLRHKYATRNIRVVVASAAEAYKFAIAYREPMLPGVPIVHVSIPVDTLGGLPMPPNVAGRGVDLDPAPTLELALRLHPDVRRVVVVVGATRRDRAWEERIRQAATPLRNRLEFVYLSAMSTEEILRRVAALPRDTIVYTPGYFSDGAGTVTTPVASVQRIAAASSVPVYGALETFVGTGAVGGYVTPFASQAREAGILAVRFLNGAHDAELDRTPLRQVPVVDWRQLRRWSIDERLLPADTVVAHRDPTLWDRYAREISIGVAVVLLQAALIAALLLERRSRQRASHALAKSREQMELAASAARVSMWLWDLRGAPPAAAASPADRASTADGALPFEQVIATVHPDDRALVRAAVERALASGETFDVEYRTIVPGGPMRWVAARGRAEHDGTGRMLGTALDITDRKATELRAAEDRAALRHMSRISVAGQLSAAIAHQLNQPLAAILGNAETARKMLARDSPDVAELRAICDDIASEDRRAADIIRRLVELYKRGDTPMAAIDLNRLVLDTLDLSRNELLTRHIVPATDLSRALPAIEGSAVQLQQVVLNLALNAADALTAIPEGERRLTIRTRADAREVHLDVEDNGPGVPREQRERVFDPFWSTKEAGMGMGLAVCQAIVLAHRGRIAIVDGAGGAVFRVSLPIRREP